MNPVTKTALGLVLVVGGIFTLILGVRAYENYSGELKDLVAYRLVHLPNSVPFSSCFHGGMFLEAQVYEPCPMQQPSPLLALAVIISGGTMVAVGGVFGLIGYNAYRDNLDQIKNGSENGAPIK
jgi:hypothetical protein